MCMHVQGNGLENFHVLSTCNRCKQKDLKKGKLSMNRRYIERSQMFLVCFILTANGRYKKIISLVPKGAESQNGDRNANQVFKDKFLSKFLWRVAKYNLNEQAPHGGVKWVWIKRSRITCTLTISCKLHLKSNQSSKSLQKLHTGPIFCFAGYPSLFLTILRRGRLKQHDPRFVRSSEQTAHYSTQNDSPVPPFITNIVWVLKTHLRTSNSLITRSIKDIFDLKTK